MTEFEFFNAYAGRRPQTASCGLCWVVGPVYFNSGLLLDIAKRILPIASLLKHGVKVVFNPDRPLLCIVREVVAELSTPPVLVYPNFSAVIDN